MTMPGDSYYGQGVFGGSGSGSAPVITPPPDVVVNYFPERTIPYRTYLKTVTVLGLQAAFAGHPDSFLSSIKVTLQYPRDQVDYPCVVVRFYEREIKNAGISHSEVITFNAGTVAEASYKFKHYYYNGDFEFAVFALSSYDRDLVADSLVQILTMADMEQWTIGFLEQVYPIGADSVYPGGYTDVNDQFNYVTLNTDKISGFGDTEAQVAWQAEDDLVYQTSYRIGMNGEYYSLPGTPPGHIDDVIFYPYTKYNDPLPQGLPITSETGPWLGEGPKTLAEYAAEKAAYEAQWRYGMVEPGTAP